MSTDLRAGSSLTKALVASVFAEPPAPKQNEPSHSTLTPTQMHHLKELLVDTVYHYRAAIQIKNEQPIIVEFDFSLLQFLGKFHFHCEKAGLPIQSLLLTNDGAHHTYTASSNSPPLKELNFIIALDTPKHWWIVEHILYETLEAMGKIGKYQIEDPREAPLLDWNFIDQRMQAALAAEGAKQAITTVFLKEGKKFLTLSAHSGASSFFGHGGVLATAANKNEKTSRSYTIPVIAGGFPRPVALVVGQPMHCCLNSANCLQIDLLPLIKSGDWQKSLCVKAAPGYGLTDAMKLHAQGLFAIMPAERAAEIAQQLPHSFRNIGTKH